MSQWIVIDKDGNLWGPFEGGTTGSATMMEFVKRKWPDQEQDTEDTGKGWNVRALRSPDA